VGVWRSTARQTCTRGHPAPRPPHPRHWHQLEQVDFVEEWTIQEDRLLRLDRAAADGVMSAAQRARYEELRVLVDQYRPIVTRLGR
jgi:hypothetical protein